MKQKPNTGRRLGLITVMVCGLTGLIATCALAQDMTITGNTEPSKAYFTGTPLQKPTNRALSAAMCRLYDTWNSLGDFDNEFYTRFKYSRLTGIGKDSNVSRRDPSKVVKVGDTYFVWYTRRKAAHAPVGLKNYTDDIPYNVPATDWDLADIFYATSRDGFDWKEQGVAVARNPKGDYADRSLSTPDILCVNGKYYLYYQAFTGRFSREKGDRCNVTMAWADSPHGPWIKLNRTVLERGEETEWDGATIHDPYPLVYKGQIWLYYKSDVPIVEPTAGAADGASAASNSVSFKLKALRRMHGVAMADRPEGPFVKSPLNPVSNSGHETTLFPYKGGIVSIIIKNGPEKNTIQYAPDGLNFEIKSTVVLPPVAGGPFCPDAFSGNGDGRGICWGLSHIIGGEPGFLLRFDCDLHRDIDRSFLSQGTDQGDEATHFQPRTTLSQVLRNRFQQEALTLEPPTISGELGHKSNSTDP